VRRERKLLRLIQRAQRDLEQAAIELATEPGDPEADDVGQDIDEVRARVQALEQRVEAIESRAHR
jgi:hypothetical protein